jgi:hypothetical protein
LVRDDAVGRGNGQHLLYMCSAKQGAVVPCVYVPGCAGLEKLIRVFDLQRPDGEPACLGPATDSLRSLLFMPGNNLLLASYVDKPNTE